ncbi:hypothetical protein [Anaerotignum sp.]|uniref:hypothetical protein n=1 Tax=Anaerotignum sp. TaxID=2039241 RepID=UPI0028A17DF4|nr:hypothetical protein [Anaerotignum sp.]
MKTKGRRLIYLFFIVVCIIIIKKVMDTPILTGSFQGTYSYEGYTVSVTDTNEFYLMNQVLGIYIKGEYEREAENVYYLEGTGIQSQEIRLKNKVFILVFYGNEMKFAKISDSAMFIEGLEDLVVKYEGKLKVSK